MKQRTLAMMTGFEQYTRKTRRAIFLEEMEQVVPWRELCALVAPHYPKPGNGRPPVGVERMLRIYFLQQWFNLSDPAVEEALYDSGVMRQFVGIDLGCEPVPDETTVCKFRHLLEQHQLGEQILGQVNLHLQAQGVRITTGTIVDATILHAPTSTKNPGAAARSGDAPDEEGQTMVLRDEGARGGRQQDEDHPHGGGDGGQCSRFGGAARSIARRRNASVGRSGLSWTDRSDPGVRAAGSGLHPSALPLQESYRRSGAGEEPHEVYGALEGGARVCGDEAEVRICETALSRTEEERHSTVRGVCAGEPVSAAEKIVVSDTGLTRERRLPITSEPPKRAEKRKNESERLDRHIRTLTTAKTWAYSELP